jgi:hypothetical protein
MVGRHAAQPSLCLEVEGPERKVADGNMINISITAGDSNEVAISQQGNANSSQVAQIGSMNIVGISQ